MPGETAAAIAAMDDYLKALNARDSDGMRAAFHYPHYRFASGQVQIYETSADYSFEVFDARTRADAWAYSEWDRRDVIHAGPEKVHLDVQFTRYRADGSAIASYRSVWIFTLEDGRWAAKARSSFAV